MNYKKSICELREAQFVQGDDEELKMVNYKKPFIDRMNEK